MNPQDILAHIQAPGYRPGKVKDLARNLGVEQYEYRAFRQAIKELERQGQLVRLRHNRYAHPSQLEQSAGLFRLHPQGYGWVERGEGEAAILIPPEGMGSAAEGDLVRVEIAGRRRHPEGRVVEILQRAEQQVVGTFFGQGRNGVVRPDENRWGRDVYLSRRPPSGVRDGYKVKLRLLPGARGAWEGEIEEVLGDPADPRLDFLTVVAQFGLPLDHPPAVVEEVAQLSADLGPALAGRRDLRGITCLTVDPADARDFDDAVSIESLDQGAALLGVHIADVGHYVRAHTALDREALRRGTSVYLADRAIPMLPQRLASQLCTLVPGEDRLTLSVLMRVEPSGEVGEFEVVESVIRSAARLTYEEVQAVFDGETGAVAGAFSEPLSGMRALSLRLKRRRLERGALDFDLPTPRVELDGEGLPTALGQYPRLQSHQLIEEFMLAANTCVGRLAQERELPVLFRVHRHPDQEKLRHFSDYLRAAGVRFDRSRRLAPKDLQQLLGRFSDQAEGRLVNRLLLRAMMRAEYTPVDIGHYGLASEHYLHFTSPIRRYPDLLVHRVVKAYLAGASGPDRGQLPWIGVWTSNCERRADAAERAYLKSKQLRYMESRLGQEYPGLVSGVLRSGFFVELEGLMVEGFCALAFLDEYCEYDERRQVLRGQRTGRTFALGAPVRVQVARVDWSPPRLDLKLLDEKRPGRAPGKPPKKQKKTRR
ncbi:MAG: ribonuclease R [Candidatus Handelsmanbacteria bacterium]|nr:ribonuclease R [Candidatus Handelsmanbacteria bacterium]